MRWRRVVLTVDLPFFHGLDFVRSLVVDVGEGRERQPSVGDVAGKPPPGEGIFGYVFWRDSARDHAGGGDVGVVFQGVQGLPDGDVFVMASASSRRSVRLLKVCAAWVRF